MKKSPGTALVFSFLLTLPGLVLAAPPANDNFDSAVDLGSSATAAQTGTADEATVEADEPFVTVVEYYDFVLDEYYYERSGSTVWWKWTCPVGPQRLVKLDTNTSTEEGYDEITFEPIQVPMDTILMVFTGATLASLTPVAEGNDTLTEPTSELSFIATPGTTYYIRVDSGSGYPYISTVELSLSSEAGPPATADAHVAWGRTFLTYKGDWSATVAEPNIPVLAATALQQAEFHFKEALKLSKSHPEGNALLALVSLLKLEKEPAFDALLAQLGVVDSSPDPDRPNYTLEEDANGQEVFDPAANTTQALAYAKATVRPRLTEALAMLEKITSTTFLVTLPDSLRLGGTGHLDYGDVVLLQGGCKVLLAMLDVLETYQFAAPLQEMQDLFNAGVLDAQHASDALSGLLKFSATDRRASIKTNLQAAIALYNKASTHIRTKRPLARDPDHLFPLRDDAVFETDLRAQLDRINKSLGGTTIIENGWSINLAKMLTGTVSFRDLAPTFKGNKIIRGSVPKPDLAGALPGSTKSKVETFLRDEGGLFEDLIQFGTQVAPGQELRGMVNEPGGFFLPEASHSVSATPTPGYVFTGWKYNDETVSVLSPYIFPVVREYTLLAHFSEDNRDDDKDGLSNFSEVELGTNRANADTDGDGWPDGLDASPTTADARAFMVSQNLGSISLDLPVGTILSVKNLPSGVTYDAKTQRLVGRPNFLGAGVNIPKSITLIATVKPSSGANFNLNLTFTIAPLPPTFFGSFHGLVDHGVLNNSLGGSVKLDITNAGGVTGKIIMAGVTYTLPANLRLETLTSPAAKAVLVVPAMKPVKTLPAVHARLSINPATGEVTGHVSTSATPGEPGELDLLAQRQVAPAALAVGSYNSHLTPSNNQGDLAYPQGTGYSILKVANTGVITWTGKLADGTGITGSAGLGAQGQAPLHLMLYANRGSIQGWSTVGTGLHASSSPLSWVKKNILTTTRSYKSGFPTPLGVDLNGSLYDPKSSPFLLLNLSAGTANTDVILTEANLGGTVTQRFGIVAPATVKIDAALNGQRLVLSIAASSGIFKGSITPTPPGRKAELEGIIVPHLSLGSGFFLLPESALATSAILSGKAVLSGIK